MYLTMCEDDNIASVIIHVGYLMQSDVCLATSALQRYVVRVLSICLWVAFPSTYSIGELLALLRSSCLLPFLQDILVLLVPVSG